MTRTSRPFDTEGHHRHHLCHRGEPHGAELPEHAVQPAADDVQDDPGRPQPQCQPGGGLPGRLPHVQPAPAPLLLHGS